RSPCSGGGMNGGRLPHPLERSQGPDRVEAETCLQELPRQLPAPRARGVERLVFDAAEVRGELDPFLVERADASAAELGDREPELEDDVLARARTETLGLLRQCADVVAGQENDREGNRGLRLELFDQGGSAGSLLVEDDRLESELHQEARDLLLHLAVPSVDDPDLAVRGKFGRSRGPRRGFARAFREPE